MGALCCGTPALAALPRRRCYGRGYGTTGKNRGDVLVVVLLRFLQG